MSRILTPMHAQYSKAVPGFKRAQYWMRSIRRLAAFQAEIADSKWQNSYLFLIVLLLLSLSSSPLSAKVNASLKAHEDNNFARIIINFDHLPEYKKTVDDTIFVISFREKVEIDVAQLVNKLPNYVGVARLDPEKRAISLALVENYKVNLMEVGNKIFIDLLGLNWKGAPPPLPQDVLREVAAKAAAIESRRREEQRQRRKASRTYSVKLRVGQLPTFSRLVFDWNKFVSAKIERQGAKVKVVFGQSVKIDVGRVKHAPPEHVKNIQSDYDLDTSHVIITVDPKANVRGFREGDDYVVDISLNKPKLSNEFQTAVSGKKNQQAGKTNAPKPDGAVNLEGQPDGAQNQKKLPENNLQPKATMNEFSAQNQSTKIVTTSKLDFDPNQFTQDQFENGLALNPRLRAKDLSPSNDGTSVHKFEKMANRNKSVQIKSDETIDKKAASRGANNKEALNGVVSIEKKADLLTLSFDFISDVSAAGFVRDDTIWLLFDSDQPIDITKYKKEMKPLVRDVHLVKLSGSQLIQIKLARRELFILENDGQVWQAKIGALVSSTASQLKLNRGATHNKKGMHISVPVNRPGRVHWLKDNDIGDRLVVVTSFAPVSQLLKRQRFVEFTALSTAHSIALEPSSDDLNVTIGFQEVIIDRPDGLHLSSTKIQPVKITKQNRRPSPRKGFLDFKSWKTGSTRPFIDQLSDLERKISLAEDKEKNRFRRQYARYLIANKLGAEALGIIKMMQATDPFLEKDPETKIIQGAANIFLHRPDDALRSLNANFLKNNQHASLWRGVAQSLNRDWSDVLREIRHGADVVDMYPQEQRSRFHMAAAEAALQLNLLSLANRHLKHLKATNGNNYFDMKAKLLTARYLKLSGKIDEAIGLYEIIKNGTVEPITVEAKLDLLDLHLGRKAIELNEALEQLETMQMMWRGDHTELKMLAKLSNLYVRNKQYRNAFSNMKSAIIAFPDDKHSMRIQDEMAKVFKNLYLKNEAANLRPIEALSLFYDNKELIPVGRHGDEMIRRLADRLIEVDLLDHAAELLEHQVTNRIKGAARAQVAAHLAMVHLMNGKPALSLRALGRTRQPNLPKKIREARDILEARSMAELGRVDGAIDILNRVKSVSVERLKADAYWNAQQWGKAGTQLEKMLSSRWNDREALTPFERRDVLKAAISYTLADDQFSLNRLRKKFYNKMINSEDAETFLVVTNSQKKGGEEYNRLAKGIAESSTLDAFMKQYYQRYGKNLGKEPLAGPNSGI